MRHRPWGSSPPPPPTEPLPRRAPPVVLVLFWTLFYALGFALVVLTWNNEMSVRPRPFAILMCCCWTFTAWAHLRKMPVRYFAASACVGTVWSVVLLQILGLVAKLFTGRWDFLLPLAIGQMVLVVLAPLSVLMVIIVVNRFWEVPPQGVA
jgi:hypothetical protein